MAFKIYKKNNYIIVEDTISGKQYQGLAKNVFVYKDLTSESTYDFEGLTYNGLKGVSLRDLIDENNVSFTDEQSFIDFYTENTGNFNSGGGSPQLFKGKYTSLSALQTAHSTANIGEYAQVDVGIGSNVVNYIWDEQDGWVKSFISDLNFSQAEKDNIKQEIIETSFLVLEKFFEKELSSSANKKLIAELVDDLQTPAKPSSSTKKAS